ncbi:MAG: hypothetical protein ACR2OZ_00565 [Verrucomicrobiales bacterium]
MADDPNKIAEDRRTISDQPFEMSHAREQLRGKFPAASPEALSRALATAKAEAGASEDRDRIMARASQLLS